MWMNAIDTMDNKQLGTNKNIPSLRYPNMKFSNIGKRGIKICNSYPAKRLQHCYFRFHLFSFERCSLITVTVCAYKLICAL